MKRSKAAKSLRKIGMNDPSQASFVFESAEAITAAPQGPKIALASAESRSLEGESPAIKLPAGLPAGR